MEEWKLYKLKQFTKNVSRRFDFKKHQNVVFVNTSDVLEGKFLHKNLKKSDELPGQAKKAIIKGDILFSEIRPKNKRYAFVDFDSENYVVSTKFMVIDSNDSVVDKKYFLQLLTSNERLDELQSIAEGRSGTFPQITFDAVANVEFNLPPLQEQIAIASILSALDDKIELNLQMNKTLEEMAMALYKHWFVDFGPFQNGKFIDSELGMIPAGWEVKRLVDFATLTMGQSPKSEFYNNNNLGLPFHQGVSDYGIRFPQDKTYSTFGNKFAIEGDILFSVRAPVGRINISKNKIILGRGLASIRMEGNNNFLFYSLKTKFSSEDTIGSGTVFNSVNKIELEKLLFVNPSKKILEEFKEFVQPLDEIYFNNVLNNESLKILRDTLLPKLISGEVRVKDIQQLVEASL